MPNLPRFTSRPFALAVFLLSPLISLALSPPNRIATVDAGTRGTIARNVAGRTKLATDLGPAPSDRRVDGITLFFSRTAAQQTALDQLLVDQQTLGSPRYHQWLTPKQFGAQFGISAADLAKVSGWLTAQGLTITYTAPSNSLLTVSGTVAQIQQAFGTSLHVLLSHGEQHIGNLTDPVVPASIANVVSGIAGLNDFRPTSHARAQTVLAPAFTSAQGQHNHYLAPGDFQTIYDSKPLLSSAINGAGATIAVMGQTNLSLPDIAAFRSASGLPAQVPTVIVASTTAPVTSGGDVQESQLDVEWAGASAPNARVVYVTSSSGVFDALQYAITQQSAPVFPILAISYGSCEANLSGSYASSFDALFQQANSQGQTILASSGDTGATDCDSSPTGSSTMAADGLAVDFPASSPSVTAIGGTMFNDTDANWLSTTGSTDQVVSALGYIPESVWNEYASTTPNALSSSGGGASLYFPKPVWQVATGVPADNSRDVPDIALNAAANHVGYLFCIPVIPHVTAVDSCTNGFRDSAGYLAVVGGTSAGTPSFAGILAQIEQKLSATSGLGNINPILYSLGGSAGFHDITTGNNSSPCAHGSPDCQIASSIGFSAGPGYDLATGLGSIDANVLASVWSSAKPAGGSSTTGSASSYVVVNLPTGTQSCGVSSGSLIVNVQVSALNAVVPTGAVQLLIDGTVTGAPIILTNGLATLAVTTSGLSSGAHSIAALYTGSTQFAPSKGYLGATLLPPAATAPNTIIDVVSSTSPDFSFTPCLPSLSVRSGAATSPITLTAAALNGFSGPVAFTVSTDANLAATYTFSASPVTISPNATGTTTLTFSAFTTASSAVSTTGNKRIPSKGVANVTPHGFLGAGVGTAALASVLFLVMPRRRRSVGLLAVLISAGIFGVSGCGSGTSQITTGSGSGSTLTTPTETGTYLVNVTASGTNSSGQVLVHTVFLTLTVTN
jgi:subtilase family serine protease